MELFEVKYISISWYDENNIQKIEESSWNISVEKESENKYNIELQTYPKINGMNAQVAFHFKLKEEIEPYFIDVNENKIPLLEIEDPISKKVWWIENGKWNPNLHKRESLLWNHAGSTKIVFKDIECNINILINNFRKKELDLYLNDFKNDFWYLILKKDSITQGEVKENKVKILNQETTDLINKFIEFVSKILENPKKELKEIQGIKDIKKVKPVRKTFIELSMKGFQKKLTSRDTQESYNVAENRFVYYLVDKIYNIVSKMLIVSENIGKIYEQKLKYDAKRIKSFSNTKMIDKETFENEIKYLKIEIEKNKQNLKQAIDKKDFTLRQNLENEMKLQTIFMDKVKNAINQQVRYDIYNLKLDTFVIELQNRQEDYGNKISFLGKIKKESSTEWESIYKISLKFNNKFNFLTENKKYKIKVYYRDNFVKSFHNYYFEFIEDIKLIEELDYRTIYVRLNKKLDKKSNYNKIQFWGSAKNNFYDNWFEFKNKNDSLSIQFNKDIFGNLLNESSEYKITGYIRKIKRKKSKNNGYIYIRDFEYIDEIELLNSSDMDTLNKLESQRDNLEKSNWVKTLTDREIKEQEQEKESLKQTINLLKETTNDNSELLSNLQPILNRLNELLVKLENMNIKKDSYFPNSMTFIQNPNYHGAYSFYKKIDEIVGIDESLFIQMNKLEKIGLLEIFTIYERWCYLQIIKILIEKYRFQPESNWKIKLANQILSNSEKIRNINITFRNESIQREIILWYEKILDNGKRPDFILEIKSMKTNNSHKLVMDAKFHDPIDIKKQINYLYKEKDYSESKESENKENSVFILHPDINKPIKYKRTPKIWGNEAYYGEVKMFNFDWDTNKSPNHKYGAILLSPINNKGNYLDNLQRLIGMGLQYSLEDNQNIKNENLLDPEPKERPFCLICGSDKYKMKKFFTKSNRGYRYQFICDECKHFYIYNYCWSCGSRLIKNGEYWTYHSNQVLEPFNIRCPNCGEIFIPDFI